MAKSKAETATQSAKDAFLEIYEREHATTLKVLLAYPKDKLELKPDPKSKTARELAWIFVQERGLGMAVWGDAFAKGMPSNAPAPPPESLDEVIAALEKVHRQFGELVAATPED